MHPVSLLTPKPIRNVQRAAAKTVNPLGALGDAVENQALRAARGGKRKRGGGGKKTASGRATIGASSAGTSFAAGAEELSMTEERSRQYLGAGSLILKKARQGEPLELMTDGGARVRVTISDVLDPVTPRADYDEPGRGQHLVAVRFVIENLGPSVFAYDPSYASKLIGAHGGEYTQFSADLPVPSFSDVVHIAAGDSRSAFVAYAVADGERPAGVEVVFGLDLKGAEIGQWKIDITEPYGDRGSGAAPRTERDSAATPVRPLELWTAMLGDVNVKKRQVAASGTGEPRGSAERACAPDRGQGPRF